MRENLPLTVSEVMVHRVLVVDEETAVATALEVMETARVRHLPVIRDGRLVGILSDRDLVGPAPMGHDPASLQLQGRFSRVCVGALMSRNPLTLSPEGGFAEAIALLLEHRLNALPVVDRSGRVVGIFTPFEAARVALDLARATRQPADTRAA